MSGEQERIQISPKLEESFFNPNTGVHESSPPVDFRGEPIMGAVLPEDLNGECKHYWKINAPLGETSQGTCKHCGEQRGFSSSHGKYAYDDGRSGPAWRAYKSHTVNGSSEEDDEQQL